MIEPKAYGEPFEDSLYIGALNAGLTEGQAREFVANHFRYFDNPKDRMYDEQPCKPV